MPRDALTTQVQQSNPDFLYFLELSPFSKHALNLRQPRTTKQLNGFTLASPPSQIHRFLEEVGVKDADTSIESIVVVSGS